MSRILILDTGFSLSILQRGLSRDDVRVTTMKPYGVTAEILDIKRQHSVSFVLNGREFSHAFPVCSLPTDAADLLGTDVMERAGAVIDFECGKMSPASAKCPECIAFHQQGTRHSQYSQRVNRVAALNPRDGEQGALKSSSQPVPAMK